MGNYVSNGRGSKHSTRPFPTWQRHTYACQDRKGMQKNSDKKCSGKCRNSRGTQEMRFFALLVALHITKRALRFPNGKPVRLSDIATMNRLEVEGILFLCPITGDWTPVGEGEADRVIPGAKLGIYEPGNVCLVSAKANSDKSDELPDPYYASKVKKATETVLEDYGIPKGNSMPDGWREVTKPRLDDDSPVRARLEAL